MTGEFAQMFGCEHPVERALAGGGDGIKFNAADRALLEVELKTVVPRQQERSNFPDTGLVADQENPLTLLVGCQTSQQSVVVSFRREFLDLRDSVL
jgi:hypothetical protein